MILQLLRGSVTLGRDKMLHPSTQSPRASQVASIVIDVLIILIILMKISESIGNREIEREREVVSISRLYSIKGSDIFFQDFQARHFKFYCEVIVLGSLELDVFYRSH